MSEGPLSSGGPAINRFRICSFSAEIELIIIVGDMDMYVRIYSGKEKVRTLKKAPER